MLDIELAKDGLRRRMRARRRAFAADRAAAAEAAVGFLPDWRGRVVGGYRAVGSEFDPSPVLAAARAAGSAIALPAIGPAGSLVWRAAEGHFVADALGVPAPPPSAQRLTPAVVLAPLLAFDARGGRLGQGGGHFDRTIAALRAAGPLLVVGLAFAAQEVLAVPMAPHDQGLDAILTERGYRGVRKDL